MADEFNFFISKQEVLGSRVIAFDDINNRLLFFTTANDKREGYLIDLARIKTSTLKKEYTRSKSDYKIDANTGLYVNNITLQLDYKSGAHPLALPFYERATDSVFEMRERSQKAVEWQSLLSKRLATHDDGVRRRKKLFKRRHVLN